MDGKEFTVSEVIDGLGINGHTWLMFVLLGLANIFDGYDFMVINVTNSYVAATFWPDAFQVNAAGKMALQPQYSALMGSLTTWGLLGMVLGGATGGILSDKIGRKKMLTIAVLFYGVFTLPQAFANDVYFFAAFRLIAGFGVGSCIPVVTTCFSETIPSQHRGVFVTFGMAFMVAGWVLAGLIGNPIASNPQSILGDFTNGTVITAASLRPDGTTVTFCENWRLCYLIGALPIIYGIALFFLMKETPHWFANSGQKDKACEALQDLAKSHAEFGQHTFDPNLLVVPPKPANVGPNVLFSKKYIVATAAIWTTYFVGQFCVYGMNAWIPTWFQGVGYSAADSTNLQTWNNFAAILSNISVGFVSDRIGRKKNLAGSWIACIIAIVLCSMLVQPNNMALCVVLMLLFGFCLNYAITAVQPLMPESYPTALRNTGVAWCQAFARFGGSGSSIVLGAIAAAAMFQTAEGTTNWSMVVLVLIVPFLLGFICTILFVRETGGKTMDQLAAEATTEDKSDTGTVHFGIMMVVAAILFILCIVCPLVVNNWTKSDLALPLMTIGMLLPFVYFFIFATPQIKNNK